jgi:hypothetical protein
LTQTESRCSIEDECIGVHGTPNRLWIPLQAVPGFSAHEGEVSGGVYVQGFVQSSLECWEIEGEG